jgi:branched-chain amino acid transport system permease protein
LEISAELIWQAVVNGLALGWIYVLMALGLTLIFGIMNIMQFAHGEIYMVGAYIVYYLTASFKVPLFPAIGISMLIMAAGGLILERLLFRRLRVDFLPAIIGATGLQLILQSGAVVVFGLYQRNIPILAQGSFTIMGSVVPKDRVVAVLVAMFLSLALYVFLKVTKFGQAMVGSAENAEGAILQGISPNRMAALSMAVGCALAAAGGVLAGSLFVLQPFMGLMPLMKGMTILVLGGMGSLPGAFIGGMILGLIDGVVPILWGPGLASITPLCFVIVVLLIKPQGLFGHE